MSRVQNSPPLDDWHECRHGAIRDVVESARQERRSRAMRQSGMITASLMLLLAGTWSLGLLSPQNSRCGGLSCSETADLAHRMLEGHGHMVTADQRSRLTLHLLGCERCANLREQMVPLLPGLGDDTAGTSAWWPVAAGSSNLAFHHGQSLRRSSHVDYRSSFSALRSPRTTAEAFWLP